MAGNVWEWTQDWYADDYYANASSENLTGPESGGGKVLRGGGWDYNAAYVRSAFRGNDTLTYRFVGRGFRCAAPGN